MSNTIEHLRDQYDQLQLSRSDNALKSIRENAYQAFNKMGVPGARHEEWKYTRISTLFNKEYHFPLIPDLPGTAELKAVELPGHDEANILYFINGVFSAAHSRILSPELIVTPLEEAVEGPDSAIVTKWLGDSAQYSKDGINALNTAFSTGGVFISIPEGKSVAHPVFLYNISDARAVNVFAQPRSLVHLGQNARVQIIETYKTLGSGESFTNQVMEMIVEQDAWLEYYKLQYDAPQANLVATTHIRQVGKSHVHTVVLSLSGGIIRNNLNVVMAAPHSEAHLYGLYFLDKSTHVDNHTLVDNVEPHCFSNQLYKGIMNDRSTGVFNGKIFVRQKAQKTNAYQSNKNILLSPEAIVNAKPQLEIFADDVKCSHGCTVGQLDEEAMFYIRARGIPEKEAIAMLIHAYALDVLEHIKPVFLREYVDNLITSSLDSTQA